MSRLRLTACVLLPFAAGYYLSYLFRTINALIAGDLRADLGLSAMDLGLLTSIYFLSFAVVQLPLGSLLDRCGPKIVQSFLLLLASVGALVFALAENFIALLVGRALIGLGVAMALMAGFKAIVLWFPPERLALANGWLVMLGALGAISATAPAEFIVNVVGWRGLFAVLAGLCALAALAILLAVPQHSSENSLRFATRRVSLLEFYRDRRFWRIAPLSASGIGASWSLQGLWAAPWLRDVDGLDRASVVQHLSTMAIAVCVSALLLGVLADRLRRVGIRAQSLLAATLGASVVAQFGLVAQWPVPPLVLWVVVAAAGAATVLSFAILGEYYPKEVSGRANAALNLLHVGGAFILQTVAGSIIALWPEYQSGYPVEAHRSAMAFTLVVQLAAIAWFATPRRSAPRRMTPISVGIARQSERVLDTLYLRHAPVAGWRTAAIASTCVCLLLAMILVSMTDKDAHAGIPSPTTWSFVEKGNSIAGTSARLSP